MNYLYNGIELPDINEVWDVETYPYAYIVDDGNVFYTTLYAFDRELKVINGFMRLESGTAQRFLAQYKDGAWEVDEPVEWDADNSGGLPTWSNFDVYNADGTLYLEASDPVPVVSEGPEILRIYKSTISGIADKIREKTGKTEKFPFTKEAVSQELDAIKIDVTSYVVSEPVEFTLSADKWNGTTYTLSLKGYDNTHEPQLGLPLVSSSMNTEQVVKSALTIPQVSVTKNSDTGQITSLTIIISAITTPTIDINVAIFGVKAQEVTT